MTTLNSQYIQTLHLEAYQLMQEFIVLLSDTIAAYERSWAYRRHLAKPEKHFRVINVEELKAILTATQQNPNALASVLANDITTYLNDRSKFHFFARLSPLRSKLHASVKSYRKAHSLTLLDDRLKLVQDYDPQQKIEELVEDSEEHIDTLTSHLEEQEELLLAAETDIALLTNENEELKATVADLQARAIVVDQPLQEAIKSPQDDQVRQLRSELLEAKNTVVEQQEIIEQQRTLLQRLNEKFTKLLELAPELVAHIKKLFVPSHPRHQQAVRAEDNMAAISKDLKSAPIAEAQPKQRRVTFARQNSSRLFSSPKHVPMPSHPIKPEPAPGLPLRFKAKDDAPPPPPPRDDLALWAPSPSKPAPAVEIAPSPLSTPAKIAESPLTTPVKIAPSLLATRAGPTPPPPPVLKAASQAVMSEKKLNSQVRALSQNDMATELEQVKNGLRTPAPRPPGEQTQNTPPLVKSLTAAMSHRRGFIADSPNTSMNSTF